MRKLIVRQPNGLICVINRKTGKVIHYNITEQEYIDICAKKAAKKAKWNLKYYMENFSAAKYYIGDSDGLLQEMSAPQEKSPGKDNHINIYVNTEKQSIEEAIKRVCSQFLFAKANVIYKDEVLKYYIIEAAERKGEIFYRLTNEYGGKKKKFMTLSETAETLYSCATQSFDHPNDHYNTFLG